MRFLHTLPMLVGAMTFAAHGTAAKTPTALERSTSATAQVAETNTFLLRQTVTLHDVPVDAESVRVWVPVPSDTAWQRLLDRRVIEAPEGWRLVRQPESRGDLIYVELTGAEANAGVVRFVVDLLIERDSPVVDLAVDASALPADESAASELVSVQSELFREALRSDAPFMSVTPTIREMADRACAGETDARRKIVRLVHAVGEVADHYSKDPSKPHCGRGAAQDCIANGGGCCTDLHSLFVAMARSQGIPTRIQFGYRLNPARESVEYDPTYRCWVETWLPSSGWVATDVVVADSGDAASRERNTGRLDANRVWLWEGRGFNLEPKQAAPPIETMFGGWAEIDGVAVDPIPGTDGTPAQMRRVIRFERVEASVSR